MKTFILLIIVLFVLSIHAFGQKYDGYGRRPFDKLTPIFIDLDGDRKPDKIKPRTYQTFNRKKGKKLQKKDIKKWITFDSVTTRGRVLKSFFRYNYGTAEYGVNYWVYALRPIQDVNKDGRKDLLFYSGDDTSDETVVIVSKGSRYRVKSRRTTDSDDW